MARNRVLPWTAMPMFVAPLAGALSDRIGGRPLMATGLALQAVGLAWIAAVSTESVGYASLVGPFILSGIGMALFFAPVANVVLSAVRSDEEGKASGANNAIREIGGVFGVAVLASIFTRYGGYESSEAFTDGLVVATWVGAAVVGLGAVIALLIPRKRRPAEVLASEPESALVPQLEARLNVQRKRPGLGWNAYVVGHVDWKDTTGTGSNGDNVMAWVGELGGKVAVGSFSLAGNGYVGRGLGHQFAHITQQGDIRGWGAWTQAGYEFTPRWAVFVFYGQDEPDVERFARDNNGLQLARQRSRVGDALLRFQAGRYALGLEYFRAETRWSAGPRTAEQFAFSVMYRL